MYVCEWDYCTWNVSVAVFPNAKVCRSTDLNKPAVKHPEQQVINPNFTHSVLKETDYTYCRRTPHCQGKNNISLLALKHG